MQRIGGHPSAWTPSQKNPTLLNLRRSPKAPRKQKTLSVPLFGTCLGGPCRFRFSSQRLVSYFTPHPHVSRLRVQGLQFQSQGFGFRGSRFPSEPQKILPFYVSHPLGLRMAPHAQTSFLGGGASHRGSYCNTCKGILVGTNPHVDLLPPAGLEGSEPASGRRHAGIRKIPQRIITTEGHARLDQAVDLRKHAGHDDDDGHSLVEGDQGVLILYLPDFGAVVMSVDVVSCFVLQPPDLKHQTNQTTPRMVLKTLRKKIPKYYPLKPNKGRCKVP